MVQVRPDSVSAGTAHFVIVRQSKHSQCTFQLLSLYSKRKNEHLFLPQRIQTNEKICSGPHARSVKSLVLVRDLLVVSEKM